MEYTDEFKQFADNCISSDSRNCYVGIGNPNAQILIVGKESASSENNTDYKNNATEWKEHINNHTCQTLEYPVSENNSLRKRWGHKAWSKYQLLKESIFPKKLSEPFCLDFLNNIFTIELDKVKSAYHKNKNSEIKAIITNTFGREFSSNSFTAEFVLVEYASFYDDELYNKISDVPLLLQNLFK